MTPKIAVLIVSAAVLVPSQNSQAGDPAALDAEPLANHTLVLTLVDAITLRPVVGARVTGYWDTGHHQTSPIPSAVTGANGVARITYTAVTDLRITMTMTGYKDISTTRVATEKTRPDNLNLKLRR